MQRSAGRNDNYNQSQVFASHSKQNKGGFSHHFAGGRPQQQKGLSSEIKGSQCKQAMNRVRENHDLQMQRMRNQLERQYEVRLKDEKQTFMAKIGNLEKQIEQIKINNAQGNFNQGYYPKGNNIQPMSSYPMRRSEQMVPRGCSGHFGRRQYI